MRFSKNALLRHVSGKTGGIVHGPSLRTAIEKLTPLEAHALLETIKNMETDARGVGRRREATRMPPTRRRGR